MGMNRYQLLSKRHPSIDVRMKEYLSSSKRNVNHQDVKQWFAYIFSYLAENNLLEILYDAKRNFNINEAIFEFSPKKSNLLAEKGSKIDNELDRLTVLVNIGANGSLLPPLIIYPKITAIGKIDSGQINNEILYEYLCNGFDEWLTYNNIQRPVIVWVDKHESRMQYNLVKRLAELQIILISIPPNTSHFMQPIDVRMLTQMKKAWSKRVNGFRASNPNDCITKENFARIFLPMYASVMSRDKIKNAFRKCGIHPFDVKAPDYSKLTLKATHSNYTILWEMEKNGVIEKETQITPVLKRYASSQTWFSQSSESKVNSLSKVTMTALGAPREIISKGCDDAVCYSPCNEEFLFNEKSILEQYLDGRRTEANIDLTKESKPRSCMMKIKKESRPMQELVSLNWVENPSSYSIQTQDNLTIESDQEDAIGVGKEELLSPPTKMDVNDLRDQVKELLDPLPEMDVDAILLGPSLQDYSAERREVELDHPLGLVWKDSRFNNKEWEFGEKHSYPPISCESNLKRLLALEFKEDILSCSTRKGSENQCLINDSSPGSKRIRLTLESTDSVDVDSETQSQPAYSIWEENIDSADKRNSAYFNKCDRTVSTKNGSNQHILPIHNKSNKHKCSICDLAFDLKATLSLHVKTVHGKIKLYKCFECNQSFRLKSILTRHINTVHKKLKRFKCTYCNFTSSKMGNLTRHNISVHSKIKPYKCWKCNHLSSTKSDLLQHVKAVHYKLRSFKCDKCGDTFSKNTSLNEHILVAHKKINPANLNCWEEDPSSYSMKPQGNLTIKSDQEVEIDLGLGEKELLCPPIKMEVDDLRDQGEEIIYKELLDPLPELDVDAELLDSSLLDNSVNGAKPELDPPPYLEWEDSFLVKEEWEDEKYSYLPRSSEPNLESVLVSDSFSKDELRRTSKEKLYPIPFLKECFVSVERLSKKFTATDVPKYVDTEKVSDSTSKDELRRTSKEKLYPFLKECFVSVERLSKNFTATDVLKYVDAEKMKIKTQSLHEPVNLNWEGNQSSFSIKTQENLTIGSNQEEEIGLGLGEEELLNPPIKMEVDDQGKEIIYKVSDSTSKDELRRTSKEKLYPFLKECFVSVERLSKKFTADEVPKYAAAEKGLKFPEEKAQIGILSKSPRKGSAIQSSINDISPSSKRIRLTLEPTDNVDVESESKPAYSICEENIDSIDKQKSTYCNKCDRTFRTKKGLNRHILFIHETKCCSCDFAVSDKETLSEHIISVHINSNQYKCPICELTFYLKGMLFLHLKIDHNVLPFKCTYCDFAAGYSSRLISHVKSVHRKLKPFKCMKCNYSCSQKGNLESHVKFVHEKIKPFRCLECNYLCSHKSSLIIHIRAVHEKLKPFKCLECNRSFGLKSTLIMHMKSIHEK